MNKKLTATQAQALLGIIGGVFGKINGKGKVELTRAAIALNPISKKLEDAKEEALKKLTEGHDEEQRLLERKYQKDETLTDEEKKKADEWEASLNKDMNDALKDVIKEEHELNITPLSDETIAALYDALPNISAGETIFIQTTLGNDSEVVTE